MPISSALLAGLAKLDDLTEDSWGSWSKTMVMFFRGCGAPYIANAAAAVPDGKADIDSELVWTIYSHVHADYQGLIEEEKSGLAAWKILKAHFEKSSMSRRLKARSDFYRTEHEPSLPIDVYIGKVTSARKALKGLGCEPGEVETADILLLNLHPSWATVRTTITSNKDEQKLEDIISILNGSTVDPVKQEISDLAMAAQNGSFGSGGRRGGGAGGAGPRNVVMEVSVAAAAIPIEAVQVLRAVMRMEAVLALRVVPLRTTKGFHWCDPTNENHCHRCGRSGHIAARCIHDMPQHIKDWVMNSSPCERANTAAAEHAHYTYNFNDVSDDSDDEPDAPRYDGNIQIPLRI
ncbi:hypothetical protein MSAN_02396000 [Mycena sanguinolenta]|uniref:CCHC-type domain-containing protein n=1 Tax=Mycena sanguinolenta TaxID=230812 RepID=A0A8H7CEX8_9AGAR|nr:hypothetical protein MSAN_02396000 [Mycena sanguinolenta]